MTNNRDARNYTKGYQNAMHDIWEALRVGGADRMMEWLDDNTDRDYVAKNCIPWDEPTSDN